jgi:hypothetical protein
MEDTIPVGAQSNEKLTTIPGWRVISIKITAQVVEVECPLALEVG